MNIIVWRGDVQEDVYKYPDAGGPDLHIDPYARLVGARERAPSVPPTPVPYSDKDGRALQLHEEGILHLRPGIDI